MRPALPVAHLARVKPAEILRAERAAEQRERQQQRDQPRARGGTASGASRPRRDGFAHAVLARLLRRRRRCDRRRRRQPLERVQRIIELEVLDALLLELVGLGIRSAGRACRRPRAACLRPWPGRAGDGAGRPRGSPCGPCSRGRSAAGRRCPDRSRRPEPSGPTAYSNARSSAAARLSGPVWTTVWTEPLPKLFSPMIRARRWSWSAPATISEAEAVPASVSTITGRPCAMSPGRA